MPGWGVPVPVGAVLAHRTAAWGVLGGSAGADVVGTEARQYSNSQEVASQGQLTRGCAKAGTAAPVHARLTSSARPADGSYPSWPFT